MPLLRGNPFATRRGANYAYVTARVRAKKPKLLPKSEYTKLLAMDASEVARYLEEAEYKQEVLNLSSRYRGALLVEMATRQNLANAYREILDMATGPLRNRLLLYLGRYDVYNIKTILRGRFAGADEDEILHNLIPAGALASEDLETLLRAGGIPEVLEALRRTPFGEALKETPENVERLTEIENALDRAYYTRLMDELVGRDRPTKAFREFLAREIDTLNIRTALRLKVAGVEGGEDLFLEGGDDIKVDEARRLARADANEWGDTLDGTDFEDALPAIRETLETGNLNLAMNALEKSLIASADTFGRRYPVSILPIIDYVLRKRLEADNLRIIATGKSTGLSDDTIEELLNL